MDRSSPNSKLLSNLGSLGRDIPSKRFFINDVSQLPFDYSSTPGGTLFSTTPGGTRIIYDRSFLMQMRNSPMSKSPPKNLPTIPGVTASVTGKENKPEINAKNTASSVTTKSTSTHPGVEKSSIGTPAATSGEFGDEALFDMDM